MFNNRCDVIFFTFVWWEVNNSTNLITDILYVCLLSIGIRRVIWFVFVRIKGKLGLSKWQWLSLGRGWWFPQRKLSGVRRREKWDIRPGPGTNRWMSVASDTLEPSHNTPVSRPDVMYWLTRNVKILSPQTSESLSQPWVMIDSSRTLAIVATAEFVGGSGGWCKSMHASITMAM